MEYERLCRPTLPNIVFKSEQARAEVLKKKIIRPDGTLSTPQGGCGHAYPARYGDKCPYCGHLNTYTPQKAHAFVGLPLLGVLAILPPLWIVLSIMVVLALVKLFAGDGGGLMQADSVDITGGAAVGDYDGLQTIEVDQDTTRFEAILYSGSLVGITDAEGGMPAIQMASSKNETCEFLSGLVYGTGDAARGADTLPNMIFALNMEATSNEKVKFKITEIGGATQTDAHEGTITLMWSANDVPDDTRAVLVARAGLVALTWAGTGVGVACASASEVAATEIDIPASVNRLVGVLAACLHDGAISADEGNNGSVRLDLGIKVAGKQRYGFATSITPALGTFIAGHPGTRLQATPMNVPLPQKTLTCKPFLDCMSVVTNGRGVCGIYGA